MLEPGTGLTIKRQVKYREPLGPRLRPVDDQGSADHPNQRRKAEGSQELDSVICGFLARKQFTSMKVVVSVREEVWQKLPALPR
jgi:hypothetical protein